MRHTIYRFRVFVGPTAVEYMADRARVAGFTNVFEGTEHVHASVLAPTCETETDRLCLRQTIGDRLYGAPMIAAWRQVDLLS